MPTFLSKQYGPFNGVTWIVVIVGGVGLGIVLKRFSGGREAVGDSEDGYLPVDTADPVAVGTGGNAGAPGPQYNEGYLTQSVLAELTANPPAALTEPVEIVVQNQAQAKESINLALQRQLDELEGERDRLLDSLNTPSGPGSINMAQGKLRLKALDAEIAQVKSKLLT